MHAAIKQRVALAKEMARRPWFRRSLLVWAAISVWDTALSQLVPEYISKDAPRVYQIAIWLLNMTGGWISVSGWLLIGAGLMALGALEFAFRTTREERLRQRYAQPTLGTVEKGFLDFYVDGARTMDDLIKAVMAANKDTEDFGRGITKYGNKVERTNNPKRQHRIATQAAELMTSYSQKLQKSADFIGLITPAVAENQLGMIARETNTASLQAYADIANNTGGIILPQTIESLREMRKSTATVRGISADLNNAASVLDSILGNYIEKTQGVSDVLNRLHVAATERIVELKRI